MNSKTVITIGRQFGSGGKEIGEKLAKELGIRCYDKELLAVAAKESGLCKELFENHDEKPTNSFLYSLVMDTYSLGYTSSYSDMPINHKVFWHSLMQSRNLQSVNPVLLLVVVQIMRLKIIHMLCLYISRQIWTRELRES